MLANDDKGQALGNSRKAAGKVSGMKRKAKK